MTRKLVAATSLLVLLTTACSTQPQLVFVDEVGGPQTAPTSILDDNAQVAATEVETSDQVVVAALKESVDVYDQPGGTVVGQLDANTAFGAPTTVPVLETDNEWLLVGLPGRPNGRTGWVPLASVVRSSITYRVEVSLSSRTLKLLHGDKVVLETAVAVGAPDNPTPTGITFVTDLLRTADEASPYGPFAYGLGFRSDQLTEFAGGDGQIGIHGTNDPSSIGNAVSSGCVRAPNEVMAILAELLPLGTPVLISA